MKTEVRILRYLGLSLLLPGALAAQLLYHADQDKNAQLAVSAAKEIANGALFDKEIQNLDALSKLEIDSVLSFAQAQFKAGVAAFTTWEAVSRQLKTVSDKLTGTEGPPVILTADEAKKKIEDVQKQVDALKKAIDKVGKAAGGGEDIVKEIHPPRSEEHTS